MTNISREELLKLYDMELNSLIEKASKINKKFQKRS